MDMENQERSAPRTEGVGGDNMPREGKRPQGRNHHRRGRGGRKPESKPAEATAQGGAPANAAQAQTPDRAAQAAPQAAQPTEAPSPVTETTQKDGQKKGGRDRSRGRRDNRDKRSGPAQEPASKTETAAEAKVDQKAQRSQSDRRDRPATGARPSTGRPQRAIPREAPQAELPDMDDLLIEDAVTAEAIVSRRDGETDPAEIERILSHDPFARVYEIMPKDLSEGIPEGKVVIVGVRFRAGGKTYFFDPGEATYSVGQYAIVETARGQEFGEICLSNRLLDESAVVPPLRPVVRAATEADIAHNRENHEKENEAFRIGVQKINEHKLDMKLVTVQYTFDNSKLLFYFTSAKRVDFRELVKDLAGVFHIRIELRQIGIRDEARMIGGLGPCGRPLCCNTFLTDFGQVSMKMAKEQNLSLNSTKISGCCGRLMCCLRYEHETYVEELRRLPAPGTFVNTPDGPGVVTEVFVLLGEVKVSLRGQTDTAPKRYKRELIEYQARDRRESRSVEDRIPDDTGDGEPDSDE